MKNNNLVQLVQATEPNFNKLAEIHNAVHFERECSFAMQMLNNNSYLTSVAMSNPNSLKEAVLNVAAVGLTLSPVHKFAYLVPRDKKVCLDISYRGFIQLAVEIGSIKWAIAEIVRKADNFQLKGLGEKPLHTFDPFSKDRGDITGAYCVAKTNDGEFMVTSMPINEIYSLRERSLAWKAYQKDNQKLNPWVTDCAEMIKKTVIKRAYKSWPMVDTSSRARLDQAIDVTNSAVDEIDFIEKPQSSEKRAGKFDQLVEFLSVLQKTDEELLAHLSRVNHREIKELGELTDLELDAAVVLLKQFATKKKEGVQNEVDK